MYFFLIYFTALEYTGGVPYEVLKPILEKVSVEQLFTFENFNPYLVGETDELWEHHAKKHFRKAERQEYESWRDLYLVRIFRKSCRRTLQFPILIVVRPRIA